MLNFFHLFVDQLYFFCEVSDKFLCTFIDFFGVFFFFSSFYILEIIAVSEMQVTDIFFQLVRSFFMFLIVSFDVKVFGLILSYLLILDCWELQRVRMAPGILPEVIVKRRAINMMLDWFNCILDLYTSNREDPAAWGPATLEFPLQEWRQTQPSRGSSHWCVVCSWRSHVGGVWESSQGVCAWGAGGVPAIKNYEIFFLLK